ncbi:hypothetical protein [Bacillus ndiopicus]|uniref:hypothetical protein n=1 Tax=Bacillus ndiopicus TaxID=1347368 RepID=UPI000693BB9E|nr:hypothetical protein [Bacillus ndiopicus]
MRRAFIYYFIFFLVLSGCSSGAPTNPSAKSILKEDPQADIFQYNDLIYTNVSDLEWVQDSQYKKGNKIGKIKKMTTTPIGFKDFYATKLASGTEVFSTNGDGVHLLIVEVDGQQLPYIALIEG